MIFFSTIIYGDTLIGSDAELSINKLNEYEVLLVTGIANSRSLEKFLDGMSVVYYHMKYSDHHRFSELDKEKINRKFESISENNKIILTTEKDYVRAFSHSNENVYYLPIESKIINNE